MGLEGSNGGGVEADYILYSPSFRTLCQVNRLVLFLVVIRSLDEKESDGVKPRRG